MTEQRSAAPSRSLTVSVVIPVKDDADALGRCLRALSLQSKAPDEVIVVDNGSEDESAQVAADAGATVVRCEAPGIPAASACGYDRATTDIVLRLDADCVPGSGWVQIMHQAFAAEPHVAVFTGGARFVDGPRMLRTPLAAAYLGSYVLAGVAALGHLPVFGSNMGFRREAWQRVRAAVHLDATLHDDFDLAFHLGDSHRIRYVRKAEMGMSMRPFGDVRRFARRIRRGFATVLVHWPRDFPPVRWQRLLLLRAVSRLRRRFP